MRIKEIEAAIEAILFSAGESVGLESLARALEISSVDIAGIVKNMMETRLQNRSGTLILEFDGSYQMTVNPEYYKHISSLFSVPKKRTLTPVLLETLAIIAYQQPVTKNQIEEIRGVNADFAVNKLMEYNLVTEQGRLDAPGKPILFGTTEEFLRHFGLSGTDKLPELPGIELKEEDYGQIEI